MPRAMIEDLSRGLIRNHPERAAQILERFDAESAARFLADLEPPEAATLIQRMTTTPASDALEGLELAALVGLMGALPSNVAARYCRSLPQDRVAQLLDRLDPVRALPLRALMVYPERSAGGLMDPTVLELRESLRVDEARERVGENSSRTRYNIYVVDSNHKLVGVVNLRELFLARESERLADIMVRNPHSIEANDDAEAIIRHPGWQVVHSLPVVDEQGIYLGALRYRTLRMLESQLLSGVRQDVDAAESLGQLFLTGLGGTWASLAPIDGRAQL